MKKYDLIIVGGGPAGLRAALEAASHEVKTLIIERSHELGGQLLKQTHKFFGSALQFASVRGFDIAKILIDKVSSNHQYIDVLTDTTVIAFYPDRVITTLRFDKYEKYTADAFIIATGASEKYLAFENNDLPGIYGAGAVQTLMNQYGVMPGKKVVMVGSGNIGLIVSYQLVQAGVKVMCIIEASSQIGGYSVHASKIRRLGIPIYTSRTIKRAEGTSKIERVETIGLDRTWAQIPGTEMSFDADTLCISVGLSPMHQLLSMVGIKMKYIKELGGKVPVIDETHQTSMKGVYVCGDVSGIEEASSAMVEGSLTGIYASIYLNKPGQDDEAKLIELHQQLDSLRNGPFGAKTRIGMEKLGREDHA
ncbi:MAG: NAD(P)/FAD-dependent oxidoreductase [Candidatus Izemoplasmatales bacterium]